MVALRPTESSNVLILADLLMRLGAEDDAESLLRAATHGFGQYAKASQLWLKLSLLFEHRGDLPRALKAVSNAELIDPANPDIGISRVAMLLRDGQIDMALSTVNVVLDRDPQHLDALQRKAEILQFMGRMEESLSICRSTPAQNAKRINLKLLELYASHALCDWSNRDAKLMDLETSLRQRPDPTSQQVDVNVIPPFGLLSLPLSGNLIQREIDRWVLSQITTRPLKYNRASIPFVHNGSGRLRLGYLSADFRSHAMGHLLEGLFDSHDPDQAETYAYSLSPLQDKLTEHYRRSASHFHDLSRISNSRALEQIHHD